MLWTHPNKVLRYEADSLLILWLLVDIVAKLLTVCRMSKVDYQNKVLPWYHLSVYSVSGLFFREGRCGGDSHRHMFNSSVKIFHTSSVLQLSCNYHLELFSVVNFPAIWSLKKRTYLMYWLISCFCIIDQWFLTLFDSKALLMYRWYL